MNGGFLMHPKRKPLIAGNWKMHGSKVQVKALITDLLAGVQEFAHATDIAIFPTFVHLSFAHDLIAHAVPKSLLQLGAQNLYIAESGAFTGEVSASMLKDIGCEYVLIGHSERRTIFQESFDMVAAKFKAAIDVGLKPVLCIGETREERERQETENILREQLAAVIGLVGIDAFKHAVIAYEPVWAIGTGLTATPDEAESAHQFIRQYIKQNNVDIADTIRILYGGSMKADNAHALLAMPNIDGGLIGGASLKAESFLAICAAANSADTYKTANQQVI